MRAAHVCIEPQPTTESFHQSHPQAIHIHNTWSSHKSTQTDKKSDKSHKARQQQSCIIRTTRNNTEWIVNLSDEQYSCLNNAIWTPSYRLPNISMQNVFDNMSFFYLFIIFYVFGWCQCKVLLFRHLILWLDRSVKMTWLAMVTSSTQANRKRAWFSFPFFFFLGGGGSICECLPVASFIHSCPYY